MKQLSMFDPSTNISDYLSEIKNEITVSKKLSKSINSQGFNIIMHENKRLCYVKLRSYETFIQLQIRDSDDWQGIAMPCSPDEISGILNDAFSKYIEQKRNYEF